MFSDDVDQFNGTDDATSRQIEETQPVAFLYALKSSVRVGKASVDQERTAIIRLPRPVLHILVPHND